LSQHFTQCGDAYPYSRTFQQGIGARLDCRPGSDDIVNQQEMFSGMIAELPYDKI
jgi:hypothetical protein